MMIARTGGRAVTEGPDRQRPSRCRPLPPHVVAEVAGPASGLSEAALLDRLERALAALPAAERAAVVSAHGYGEGPVGAAVELDLSPADADALARNGLQLLRAALADVDD
jgi:DNA-directed RNA polymerase specialized sigma24 family protein